MGVEPSTQISPKDARRSQFPAAVSATSRCVWCNRRFGAIGEATHAYCSDECHAEAVRALLRRERHRIARYDALLRAAERSRLENEAARLLAAEEARCPRCTSQPQRHRQVA